jgi:hypothetical protein
MASKSSKDEPQGKAAEEGTAVVYGAEGELTQEELEAKEADEAEANDAEAPEITARNIGGYSAYDSGVEPDPENPVGVEAAIRSDEANAAEDEDAVVEGHDTVVVEGPVAE